MVASMITTPSLVSMTLNHAGTWKTTPDHAKPRFVNTRVFVPRSNHATSDINMRPLTEMFVLKFLCSKLFPTKAPIQWKTAAWSLRWVILLFLRRSLDLPTGSAKQAQPWMRPMALFEARCHRRTPHL